MCDFKSKRNESLQEHMDIHNRKNQNCENCDFKSSRKRELVAHRCKGKPKEFSCDLCGKKSATKDALGKHRQVHICNIKLIQTFKPFSLFSFNIFSLICYKICLFSEYTSLSLLDIYWTVNWYMKLEYIFFNLRFLTFSFFNSLVFKWVIMFCLFHKS